MGSCLSSLPIFVLHVCWAPCLGIAFGCRGTAEFHSGIAGVCLTASGNMMQESTVNVGKKSKSDSITFTTRKANWKLFYFLCIYFPKGQVVEPALIFFSVGKGDLGCWIWIFFCLQWGVSCGGHFWIDFIPRLTHQLSLPMCKNSCK